MKPISLVYKYENKGDSCCPSPCGSPHEDIPRVYLTGDKALGAIPEEGTITFKFKRKEVSVSDRERPVNLTLELRAILDVKEKTSEPKEESSAEALDKLLEEFTDEE